MKEITQLDLTISTESQNYVKTIRGISPTQIKRSTDDLKGVELVTITDISKPRSY